MNINQVILKPVLTEKATNLAKEQSYVFEVNKHANKHQVKHVLEQLYQVKVGNIRIILRKGKNRKVGKKQMAKQLPTRKLAIVKLRQGKIDLFPQT